MSLSGAPMPKVVNAMSDPTTHTTAKMSGSVQRNEGIARPFPENLVRYRTIRRIAWPTTQR
jgi:hypothetical protein